MVGLRAMDARPGGSRLHGPGTCATASGMHETSASPGRARRAGAGPICTRGVSRWIAASPCTKSERWESGWDGTPAITLGASRHACPLGRGAQTTGIDTATDTGTAGTQKEIKTETGAPADRGLRSKHGVEAGAQTGMDTETLCAAGEGGRRTQKEIETETGTRTDHGSKRGEEAGAQTGMDTATDWRAGGTQRGIERGTGAGAGAGAGTNGGALARTTVPVDSRMTTLRLKR